MTQKEESNWSEAIKNNVPTHQKYQIDIHEEKNPIELKLLDRGGRWRIRNDMGSNPNTGHFGGQGEFVYCQLYLRDENKELEAWTGPC